MKKIFIIGLVLVVVLTGCASYSKHPDFIERHKKIYTASIMPADVEVYRLNFKGDKNLMHELIPKVESFSKDEAENIFKKKGYLVQKLELGEESLNENPNLKTALFNVRTLFNQRLEDILRRREKKFTYSLGSEVNQFAEIADADVLVFIKGTGYKKTGGEIAKDIAKSLIFSAALAVVGGVGYMAISPNEALIQIAVVDSNTGDILWYNYNRDNTAVNLANEKSTRSLLRALFSPFPKRLAQERKVKQVNLVRAAEPKKEAIPSEVVSAALDSLEREAAKLIETPQVTTPIENYRNVIIERIKTQLPPNFSPLTQPVWLHISLLKSGAVKELGVLKEKSNSDKEIQRLALKSVDKALPMPSFPEDIQQDELTLDIPIN